jgi:hypothetical protein
MRFSRLLHALLMTGTALSLTALAGLAKADTITASLFSPLSPTGTTPVIIDLAGITAPSQTTIDGDGYTISFDDVGSSEGVVVGNVNGSHAVPVAGVTGSGGTTPEYLTGGFGSALTTNVADSGNYLSTGTGSITITFSTPETSLALLWGSIDTGNSLTLNDAADFTVTGTEVQEAASGFVGNGFQGPGGSAYVVIDSSTSFTTVTLSSSVISFESAGIAAASQPFTSPTPEPAAVPLIGLGIGLVAVFRRRFVR